MNHAARILSLTLALLGLPAALCAQATPPAAGTFTETVDVEVVNVEVFVTDKQGAPIVGLGRDDFELIVDGQPVEISNFYASEGGRPAAAQGVVATDTAETAAAPAAAALPSPIPSEQRLHLAVVVDNDHIQATHRKRVFRDLRSFLDQRLDAGDLVTMISLEPELVIHSDFLDDRAAISAMLTELERSGDRPRTQEMERRQILGRLSTTGREYNRREYSRGGVGDSPDILVRIRAWAETEFVRSHQTLTTLANLAGTMAGIGGRKALLYVSDGIANRPGEEMYVAWYDRFSAGEPAAQGLRSADYSTDYFREIGNFDLTRKIEELGRLVNSAQVTWYTLSADSDPASSLKSAALAGGVSTEALDVFESNLREPMEEAANLTGGRRIQASTRLAEELSVIGMDFDTFYSLGFRPPPAAAKTDHKIRVKVAGKGLVVRHRESWQSRTPDEIAAERTTSALLYHAVTNPLGVGMEIGTPERRDDGTYVVPVDVSIPLDKLVLVPRGDVHAAQLSLFITTRDRAGQARRVQKLPFNAAIPADKLEEALGQTARYTLPLVVRPGDQQLALGVRDDFGSTQSYLRSELTVLR